MRSQTSHRIFEEALFIICFLAVHKFVCHDWLSGSRIPVEHLEQINSLIKTNNHLLVKRFEFYFPARKDGSFVH